MLVAAGRERRQPRMYLLYSLLTAAAMVLLSPYFLVEGLRKKKYLANLRERFGRVPPEVADRAAGAPGAIWIHAVSVGEVLAARPLALRLHEKYPERLIFVSTTTATGQELARERMKFTDGVFYFPFDWTWCVRRALGAIRPSIVLILETEIWPNFLRELRRKNIPAVFVNARISKKSFGRFRLARTVIGALYESALGNARAILAQSEEAAERLRIMGAPEECIEVTGNLKYDSEPPAMGEFGGWLRLQTQQQERWPVLVAGSVVADEEEQVLAAFDIVQRRWHFALLVLAPRKPERFDAAEEIAAQGGWKVVRRSQADSGAALDEAADIVLLDSIGELAGIYSLANAVFIGGSLVASGGHNILEPAWWKLPPVFGRSMENFSDMAGQFLQQSAGVQVSTGESLGKAWMGLIEDEALSERMGRAARKLVESNRGATSRSLERIVAILEEHGSGR
jgi:3-deoxy-D-manno-octulosonic-acid transferase